jgi:protein-tyrosine phosphatase
MSSLWQSLFTKNYEVNEKLEVDLHSHFIPGIDDGSRSIEESVTLIRGLSNLGIKKIITTPHIMRGTYNNTFEIINSGLEKVRTALKNEGINVTMEAAAEYYFDEHFIDNIVKEDLLTFHNNYVLFELGVMMKPPQLEDAVFELTTRGYVPVLAHPERYSYLYSPDMKSFNTLKAIGVLLQVNMLSIIGYYSLPIQRIAHSLIKHGMYDLIGSDVHNLKHLELLPKVFSDKYFAMLMNSGDILNNKILT